MKGSVLIVIGQLDRGGAERQVVALAMGLQRFGYAAEVAVFYPDGALETELRRAGVPVHHLPRTSKTGLETVIALWKLLRSGGYAIVHPFLWPANWRARVAAVGARTPVVLASPRSVDSWMKAHHVLTDRLLARFTDAIVVNAQAIRDYLVRRERLAPSKFRVVPNGVDAAYFEFLQDREDARESLGLDRSRPVILIVGNHQPEKNQIDFIASAAHVRRSHPHAIFALVGDGPCRGLLEEKSYQLGLNEAVVWAGSQTDIRPWLASCDVAMNTSEREGCCNAILEAMAARRPVVAYAVGGNPELIEDGVTGRVHAFGDIEGLAESVSWYLTNPGEARLAGLRGRERVMTRYSLEAMIRGMTEVYDEFLHVGNGQS